MKIKMHLSLLSLVGAVLLFIFTSLAWFSVSDVINIGIFQGKLSNKEIEYVIYESDDGVTYEEITNISFDIAVPGDVNYYRIILTNPEASDYQVFLVLSGVRTVLKDGSPYTGSLSMLDVLQLTTTIDSTVIVDDVFSNLYENQSVTLTTTFSIESGLSETIDFTFTFLGSAGNEYQNLGVEIDDVLIYFND